MNMEMGFFQGGVPGLVAQGMVMDAKEGGNEKDGKVLIVSLLVSETTVRSGAEMQAMETRLLKIKDQATFGAYYALLGSIAAVPVSYMKTNDGGVFFVPKGALPKKIKLESQPPAMPKAA